MVHPESSDAKMKILLAHNRYAIPGRGSGEEVSIDAIASLLEERGHTIVTYIRSSLEVRKMRFGRLGPFFSGIYSFGAKKKMEQILRTEKPDLVLVQNLFPLISPSVLIACRTSNVPVVMRCPNYRLICPNGLFMTKGRICERCAGGKEYWCVLKNCEGNIFKSIGYALRGFAASHFSLFEDNVDVFLVLTEFAGKKLIQNGFSPEKIQVLSGLLNQQKTANNTNENPGKYVGFVGRLSPEKGVDMVIKAAKRLPGVPFKLAGSAQGYFSDIRNLPENVTLAGQLNSEDLWEFYRNARLLVAPSRWYEGLPMAIIEGMSASKPVIASDLGGLGEVVEDGTTGLLFQHDDVEDFADKIFFLWSNPDLCRRFGRAGREKTKREYCPDAFYGRLTQAFELASKMRRNRHWS